MTTTEVIREAYSRTFAGGGLKAEGDAEKAFDAWLQQVKDDAYQDGYDEGYDYASEDF